jgi:hypothetical protein
MYTCTAPVCKLTSSSQVKSIIQHLLIECLLYITFFLNCFLPYVKTKFYLHFRFSLGSEIMCNIA